MTGSRLRYVGRRLAQAVPVVLAMVVFNFALFHLAPGDAATCLQARPAAPCRNLAKRRAEFGLDKPLPVQLGSMSQVLCARSRLLLPQPELPVLPLILARLPPRCC